MTGDKRMHRKALAEFVSYIPIKGSISLMNHWNIYPSISSNPSMKSVSSNGFCLEIERSIIDSFSNHRIEIGIFDLGKHGQEWSILEVVCFGAYSS